MLVGYHFQEDSYGGPAIGAATYLDVGGSSAADHATEKMLRPYFTGRPDPVAFGQDLAPYAGTELRVVAGNEPNLEEVEHFGGGPADYAAWFGTVRDNAPGVRLYYAGMSPGIPTWRDWYTDPAAVEAIGRADGLCVHTYGDLMQLQETVAWIGDRYPDKRLWIGEFNFGAGRHIPDLDGWVNANVPPFLDWCAARPMVEAATWFSWMWDQSPTLPTTVDAWGTPVERVIASWVPPVNGAADLDGVDASNHQGLVSWPQVAGSGRRFAFVKACEDPAYVDRYFPRNWSQARAAGLVVGAYSYARPSEASPAQSVTLLEDQIEAVGGLRTGDLVCLDIEDDRVPRGQNLLQWVAEWLDLAERTFGVTPVLYSGHWYMAPHGLEDPALGRYPLWYASYQETPPPPPVGWEKISFWQSSASGTVPGVAGPCDLDSFFGSEAELAALGYAGDEPPPSDEVQPLRDQVWQHADALQALAGDWEDAGWPSTASGIGSTAEALKTIIRGTQGER